MGGEGAFRYSVELLQICWSVVHPIKETYLTRVQPIERSVRPSSSLGRRKLMEISCAGEPGCIPKLLFSSSHPTQRDQWLDRHRVHGHEDCLADIYLTSSDGEAGESVGGSQSDKRRRRGWNYPRCMYSSFWKFVISFDVHLALDFDQCEL